MKAILVIFFVIFLLIGLFYIFNEDILWGLLVEVIALVYVFGLEPAYGENRWHSAAHIFAGGIFSILISGFLILEKLMSLLSEPQRITRLDVLFMIASLVAFLISLKFVREFEA